MAETGTMSWGLSHLFLTVFLFNLSHYMVVPAITDVCMAALCPGEDQCSLAIYLTGIQQTCYVSYVQGLMQNYYRAGMSHWKQLLYFYRGKIIGIGSLVMMPLIGKLSDLYGRKLLLTFPLVFAIFPTGILAYSREKGYFYAYFVLNTLTSMVCEETVFSLSLAYLADNVSLQRRASAFGILSGIISCSFVSGNLLSRFLPSTASIFQVSATCALASVIYMRVFLPEPNMEAAVIAAAVTSSEETLNECLLEKRNIDNRRSVRLIQFLQESILMLRSSWTFSQAAIVALISTLGDLGLLSALLYYLKAEFHFNKDQFADLMIIQGIGGIISQMILLPMLARIINEEKTLAIGLAFNCIHIFLFAVAWSRWVVYLASALQILSELAGPSLRSIVSKQVGSTEQGKAQGCITGLTSLACIISPLIFSPLTALFLSDHPPFQFPGFSLLCVTFTMMIAFIQSMMIKTTPDVPRISEEIDGDA